MVRSRLTVGVLLGVATLTGACASGSGGSDPNAKDELRLGYKAARRGYWQEALYRFERADGQRPQDPEILNNLAVALEAVGRYDDAKALYERAIAMAPNDRHVRRNRKQFDEFYTTHVAPPDAGKTKEATDATSGG